MQTIAITIIAITIFKYFKDIDIENSTVYILGGVLPWFIVFGLPLFLLYFNHRKYSKNVRLEYDGNTFIYSNKNNIIKFTINDIKEIELWLTPPSYDERIDWQFFGKYHFTKLILQQNQIINISCLVFDETEDIFPKELIRKKKKMFPFMKISEVPLLKGN